MRHVLQRAAVAALALLTPAGAWADEIKPALLYDLGGRFDRSFNEAAYRGAEAYKAETGTAYRDFEVQNEAQREQALRNFARRGYDPIVAIGFSQANALEAVAADYPDVRFAIVDMVVGLPNVRSIVFKEHEGSYLAGVMAAMASKTGQIGFVGGMDIPLIRKFACGYVQGAQSVNPDIAVYQNMTGTTGAAWTDPVRGGELARAQIEKGADVVYHAAGGTGIGVLQAAADAGVLGIGVDSNQNHMQPGSVLTSMVKRVDVAVSDAYADAAAGEWTGGVQVLGLAEDGVGVAIDEHNADLVDADMQAAVDAVAAAIISGDVVVHDYMSDSTCPAG